MTTNDKPVCRVIGEGDDGPLIQWYADSVAVGSDLYDRPQPKRDETPVTLESGVSVPAWVVWKAAELGAYMKAVHGEPWAIGPVQSRHPQPAAPFALTADEREWLDYAIEHMEDDSEPEDKRCAQVLRDLLARSQPAAPQVPEGRVAVRREDAEALSRFVLGDANHGVRNFQLWASAQRVQHCLATPPAPEQSAFFLAIVNALNEATGGNEWQQDFPPNELAEAAAEAISRLWRKPAPEQPACTQRGECDCIGQCKKGRGGNGAEQPKPAGDDVGLHLSPEQCAEWLDAKYRRHGEIEDKVCADTIRRLSAKPAGDVEADAARWAYVSDKAWFIDSAAWVYGLRKLSFDPTPDPDEVIARIDAEIADLAAQPAHGWGPSYLQPWAADDIAAAQPAQGEGEK